MNNLIRKTSNPSLDPRALLKNKTKKNVEQAINELQQSTHFGKCELTYLYKKYQTKLKPGTQKMDKKTFYSAMKELIPDAPDLAIDQYYKHFDNDENGFIDFREFVSGLSIVLKGTLEQKIKFAFFCYDLDGNGYLTREELQHWVKSVFYTGINLTDSMMQSLGIEMKKKRFSKKDVKHIVDKCFEVADTNKDGRISEKEFEEWIKKQPQIISWLAPSSTALLQ